MGPSINHFARLGIDTGATEDEIKKAYRTLAKKWHPDKNREPEAKEKFQEIAASYEFLSSKDRREMHERELRKPAAAAAAAAEQVSQRKPYTSANTFRPSDPGTGNSSGSGKSQKKANAASWSESFTKNYRTQQKKQSKNGEATFVFTNTNSRGVDGVAFMFEDTASRNRSNMSQSHDIFEELFGHWFHAMDLGEGLAGGTNQRMKPRPRNVAPESGIATGLDGEYLFSPRNKADEDSTVESESSGEKLSCPWCNQLFTRGKLAQHEEKCGKFGLSADEEDEVEDKDSSDDLSMPHYVHKPTWQQQHEELLGKVRIDKQRYKDRMASQGSRNSGKCFTECPYCQRTFNHVAVAKHISWCRQYVHKYGKSMNPSFSSARMTHDTRHDDYDDIKNIKTGRYCRTRSPAETGTNEHVKHGSKARIEKVDILNSSDDDDDDDDGNQYKSFGNRKEYLDRYPKLMDWKHLKQFRVSGMSFGGDGHKQTTTSNLTATLNLTAQTRGRTRKFGPVHGSPIPR